MSASMNCSFGSQNSPCGSFGSDSIILPLVKCDEDMSSHLISLGVSWKRGRRSIDKTVLEQDLILNRAGHFRIDEKQIGNMTICPKHRRELTLDWSGRKSRTCSYPSHRGQRKQMRTARRVNALMSAEIFALHQICIPIGSGKYLANFSYFFIH